MSFEQTNTAKLSRKCIVIFNYMFISLYMFYLMSDLTLTLTWIWLYSDIPNYTCFHLPDNAIEVKENIVKSVVSRALNRAEESRLFWRKLSL